MGTVLCFIIACFTSLNMTHELNVSLELDFLLRGCARVYVGAMIIRLDQCLPFSYRSKAQDKVISDLSECQCFDFRLKIQLSEFYSFLLALQFVNVVLYFQITSILM